MVVTVMTLSLLVSMFAVVEVASYVAGSPLLGDQVGGKGSNV